MTSRHTFVSAVAVLVTAGLVAAPAARADDTVPATDGHHRLAGHLTSHRTGATGPTGRYLAVAKGPAAARTVAARLEALSNDGLTVEASPTGRAVPVDAADDDALAAVRAVPGVIDVVPEVTYSLLDTPDDPAYADQQASMNVLRLPQGWDVTHGSSTVRVAVIDTGVTVGHPDLAGKVVAGGTYNAVTGSSDVTDKVGHGTFVASVAAAATDNAVGLAGAGWNTSILAVKVSDDAHSDQITNAAVANGIDWAVAHGADVINLSLGGYTNDSLTADAVAGALSADVSVVAAAGNDGVSTKMYPAALPYVIAVGATTVGGGARASFSQFGSWVDVGAPGESVIGANAAWAGQEDYLVGDGTSFASPLVAGIVSLVKATRPDLDAQEIHNAVKASTNGKSYGFYAGVVNAATVLGYQFSLPGPDVVAPTGGATVSGPVAVDVTLPSGVDADSVRASLGSETDQASFSGGAATLHLSSYGLDGEQTLHVVLCRATLCSPTGTDRTVVVQNHALALDSPAEGAVLEDDFTMSATAPGAPAVRFLVDGTKVLGTDAAAPFTLAVPITKVPPGMHTLEAVICNASATVCATDAAQQVHVTVARLNPAISSATPNPFSPNGDGLNDATKVVYTVDVPSDVVVRFQDSGGHDVRVRAMGTQRTGSHSLTWGGVTDGGTALPSGTYTVLVDTTAVVDGHEMHGEAGKVLTLDVTAPKLSAVGSTFPTVYPYNDDYRDSTKLSVTSAEASSTVTVTVSDAKGRRVWAASKAGSAAGPVSLTFTGHSTSGSRLAGGTYVYQFRVRDKAGNLTVSGKHKVGVSWKKLVSKTYTRTVSAAGSSDGFYYTPTGDSCSVAGTSGWAAGALVWDSCSGGSVLTLHGVTLPSATVPGVARVSMYGRGTSGSVAWFGYLADDGETVSGEVAFSAATGSHSAGPVQVTSALLAGKVLRWVVEVSDGDRYEAKTFSVTYHYKILA